MDVGKGREHDAMEGGGRVMSGAITEERKLTPLRGVQELERTGDRVEERKLCRAILSAKPEGVSLKDEANKKGIFYSISFKTASKVSLASPKYIRVFSLKKSGF